MLMIGARKRKYWAVALMLLLLLGIAGSLWYRRPDASLARALALRDRLTGADAARSSPVERRRQWMQLREAIDQLTPKDRKAFWAERRRRFRAWLDDFFRSSRPEQIARLDEEIERMNAFRRREASDSASGKGPSWTAGLSEEELQQRQKLWLDLTSAEERALVDQYFAMLAQQQQQRGQGGGSPWGDAPT
jgi:hypothetical protein